MTLFCALAPIAGTGVEIPFADDIPATAANFEVYDIAMDTAENIYISDEGNNRIRKIDAVTNTITTVAGTGVGGYSGEGIATASELYGPSGVSIDNCGNLYIADLGNNRIRKLTFPGTLTTSVSSVSIMASPGDTVCAGIPVTFSATATGFGASPAYYWFVNGVIVSGSTSGTYTYTPVAGDSVYCMLYTSIPCTTNATINSNTLHMIVNTVAPPSVSISAIPGDNVCAGTAVTFNATAAGGGPAPSYVWYVDGSATATGSSNTYTPTSGDAVFCTFSTGNPCTSPAEVSSATITMTVNPIVTPTISISASPSDTVCAGASVTFSSTISGGGITPAYSWYVNGVLATGLPHSSTHTYTPATGDSIYCKLTSDATCAIADTARSNTLHLVVNPAVTASISITASPSDTVCSVSSVTFSATITGGGAVPAYQWLVNGVASGTSSAYSYLPADGDAVRCVLTSSATCAVPAIDSSNIIHLAVQTSVMPEIVIAAIPADTVCIGTPVTVTATDTNGGTSPMYQWIKNGHDVGSSSASYTYTPANIDSIRCVLTSNAACAIDTVVSSNTIDMVVDTFLDPTITIAGLTTVSVGSTVTVTAIAAGAGSSYTIYWFNDGVAFTSTTVPSVTYTKDDGVDTITALIVPTGYLCVDTATSLQLLVYASNMGVHAVTLAGLSIYPNPASETIYIDGLQAEATYRLLSMVGTVVQRGGLYVGSNSISLRSLSPGVYVLEVMGEDGEKAVRRVVKE